jgi:hypothetical protein
LRDRAVAAGDLAELTGRLNNFIAADHSDRFMTMHLSVVDTRAGTMGWSAPGTTRRLSLTPWMTVLPKWALARSP